MRYESEVLYDLMKRDGLLNPSQDNLPYESELKEKYVDDVKGSYPKLIDYRAEWLNYAYENPIGVFPYETLTNVTEATINNVVPYAYKSAILKGNTETIIDKFEQGTINTWNGTSFPKPDSTTRIRLKNIIELKQDIIIGVNDKYKVSVQTSDKNVYDWSSQISFTNNGVFIIAVRKKDGSEIVPSDILGADFNINIPHFIDMQSVQMPVLKTVGKNLFNKDNAYLAGASNQNIRNDIFIKPNTTYTFYANENNWVGAYLYDKNDILTREIGNTRTTKSITFTTTSEEVKTVLQYYNGGNTTIESSDFTGVQLEYGTQITSYEPYKSNILTVNEDVELGSVGEVKDELNLLTGQLTQRTETRAYQEGDESNSEVLTDMTNTRYKLPKEVIKTVDLTVVDHNGNQLNTLRPIEGTMNLITDGTPLKPLFSGEIPVEAITQNIASFTDLDGVERTVNDYVEEVNGDDNNEQLL